MERIAPWFAVMCIPLIAQQAVSPVAFSESKQAIGAFSSFGETTLPAARLQLDIVHAGGKSERGNLAVV